MSRIETWLDRQMQQKRYRVLSGSALKLAALLIMLLDHTAEVLLSQMQFATDAIVSIGSHQITLYWICRMIGRLAFPIYCFLLTEGYIHTHNKKKYGLNLLIFALISEIPWDLEHNGKMFASGQNVFFTLFLGFLALVCLDRYRENKPKLLISMVSLFAAGMLLNADYGLRGMSVILLMYLLRNHPIPQAVIISGVFQNAWALLAAFIPISMYNGKRGFIKGKPAKYLFYAAYPLHILLLYFLKNKFFGYD